MTNANNEFFAKVAKLASAVVAAGPFDKTLGYWQPGWVGRNFSPGKSAVIVMQNPAESGAKKEREDDQRIQLLLKSLQSEASESNYKAYRSEFMDQMRYSGRNSNGWPKWRDFVTPLLAGLDVGADDVAWLNALKPRFHDNQVTWDRQTIRKHAEQFLFQELDLLRPSAVVSHGAIPRDEVDAWCSDRNADVRHVKIPQPGPYPNSGKYTADQIEVMGRKLRMDLDKSD